MKLTVGKKFNWTMVFVFGANAVVHIITGHIYVGVLESIIALHAYSDIIEGKEVALIEIKTQKGRD
jgi:hypothetical protein